MNTDTRVATSSPRPPSPASWRGTATVATMQTMPSAGEISRPSPAGVVRGIAEEQGDPHRQRRQQPARGRPVEAEPGNQRQGGGDADELAPLGVHRRQRVFCRRGQVGRLCSKHVTHFRPLAAVTIGGGKRPVTSGRRLSHGPGERPMSITSLCLFCGSRPGTDPDHAALAEAFGTLCAARGLTLVYGGGATD